MLNERWRHSPQNARQASLTRAFNPGSTSRHRHHHPNKFLSATVDGGPDPTTRLLTEALYIFQPIFARGITAKQVPPRKLSRLIDGLVGAGLPKNVSRALVCVASKGEITSAGIEGATGLRQPEVSIAVQELRQKGWVAKRDIKKVGKGRPIHSYRLSVPLKDILRVMETAEDEKVKRIEANLKVLRELLELE